MQLQIHADFQTSSRKGAQFSRTTDEFVVADPAFRLIGQRQSAYTCVTGDSLHVVMSRYSWRSQPKLSVTGTVRLRTHGTSALRRISLRLDQSVGW